MKRALIIAAGWTLLASPAWAQSPPFGPDRDGDRMERRDMRGDRDWRGGWGRDDRDDGPRGPYGGWHGGHRHGAGFWLRSGETRLGVRCDPNEPMRACVDAATTLLDRVRALPTSGTAATPTTSSAVGADTTPPSPGVGAAASPPTSSGPGAPPAPPTSSGPGAPAPRPAPR
jgi:hypothetical protein